MSTPHRKQSSVLFNESLRVERVIYLAGALSQFDSFPDDLDSFFDDADESNIVDCLGDIPGYVNLEDHRNERSESISEWLNAAGKYGYLVQCATPAMTKNSENSRSFTWGYFHSRWFYGEQMDDVISAALAWAEERRKAEDELYAKKGGAA